MCNSATEHRSMLVGIRNLSTLKGSLNQKRRILKKAYKKQNGKCFWCGDQTYLWWKITTEEFKKIGKQKIATREHCLPKSRGGGLKNNIVSACRECNTLRGNISFRQFKYVSETVKRYARFKELKALKSLSKKQRKNINGQNRRTKIVLGLAVMFHLMKNYKAGNNYETESIFTREYKVIGVRRQSYRIL